jgi:hypothetical protein
MTPVAFELPHPFVNRPERQGIRAVQHAAAVATRVHEADVGKYAEVLRHRWLLEAELESDLAHRVLGAGKEGKNIAPTRLRDGIEGVGGCGSSGHGPKSYSH